MHYEQADWLKKLNLWGRTLGFSQIGIADVNLQDSEPGLLAWLAAGFHGDMGYMDKHGLRRTRPAELVPGTVSIITPVVEASKLSCLDVAHSSSFDAKSVVCRIV